MGNTDNTEMVAPILIGLNGYKHAGRHTAAKYITEWASSRGLRSVERAFAELLKLSAARSLGLATNINDAVVLMDELKENGVIDIAIPGQSIMRSITGREFLKWYGTEGHRDVFGSDFWTDLVLPRGFTDYGHDWTSSFDDDDGERAHIGVITDCRFANEARRIKELGGVVWKVDRGLDPEDHPSEQPLPDELVDLVLDNKSSLEAFEVEVRTWMTAEFHMRFVQPEPVE